MKGVAEIVNHDHIIVGFEQFQCRVTANVTQTTRDKYVLTVRNVMQEVVEVLK